MAQHKAMKRRNIKSCGVCGQGLMHSDSPMFYSVSVQAMMLDLNAIRREHGLELQTGSPALAAVFSPNENLAVPVGEANEMYVCMDHICDVTPFLLIEGEDDADTDH